MISTVPRTATRRRLRRAGLLVAMAALALSVQAAAGSEVPFRAADSGTFYVVAGSCPEGFVALDINGSGKATHVGRYTIHADECFDGASSFFGRLRITAVNGDMLFANYAGTVPADLSGYTETAVVSGGTGRFAGAQGELDVVGVITGPDTYSQTMSGTVSSPGSAG